MPGLGFRIWGKKTVWMASLDGLGEYSWLW
jgi:hypothetical protein